MAAGTSYDHERKLSTAEISEPLSQRRSMRRVPIHRNNAAFRSEQLRSGNGRVPPIAANSLSKLPGAASILIGDRSADFGGGLASTGYVMVAGKAVGTVAVSAADVQRGALEVK